MGKSREKSEQDQSAENAPAESTGSAAPAASQQQRVQVEIDDSKVMALYANFCRVMGTPEEMIIDFGLNPQPVGVPKDPVAVTQRIITNYYTAKRMLMALQVTIQRHEAAFGVLELDVQKRLSPQARG
jgi:hypothetical protein